MRCRALVAGGFVVLLLGCVAENPAPVIDKSRQSEHAYSESEPACKVRTAEEFCHVVERGDTLYSISRRYDLKVVEIASRNNISAPFIIRPDEMLVVRDGSRDFVGTAVTVAQVQSEDLVTNIPQPRQTAPARTTPARTTSSQPVESTPARRAADNASSAPQKAPQTTTQNATTPSSRATTSSNRGGAMSVNSPKPRMQLRTTSTKSGWQWPVPFEPQKGSSKSGLDYVLADGVEVVAAIAGKVIYAGAGLNKFRHLIIVDTNSAHLVAYEFNTNHAISEGQQLKRGELITRIEPTTNAASAEAGRHQQFHFEIWANGKPLNPNSVIASVAQN